MARTVNPQISSVLNSQIGAIRQPSRDGLPQDNSLPRSHGNVQTLPVEMDVTNSEIVHTDLPPSYDSLPPRDHHINSPNRSILDEEPAQNTIAPGVLVNPNQHLTVPVAVKTTTVPLTGIDACIDRLIRDPFLRQHRKTVPDTLIFIDRLCLQNRDLEDQLQEYYLNRPILVERSKLEALNSPYFNKCLSGMYQTRKWKFLAAKVTLCTLPSGIKYIINMTPDNEGLEAVEAIQNLSCPFGVLHWKKSFYRWSIRKSLVGGVDENDIDIESDATAMEYSLVRHVKSIERFMAALQGCDPQLDTAPKVYSTVMVSKAWGIQGQHPLTDYVARWLCDTEANSKFVEAYPEIVLKMADVLKCAPFCKDAFAVLVGEAALDATVGSFITDQETVYERVKGDIEEDWLSRVQHARNSFVDRIRATFDSLAGADMAWVSSLSTVRNIQSKAQIFGCSPSQFDQFLALLKRFIRGTIFKLLCDDYENMTQPRDQIASTGDDLYPRAIEKNVWGNLRAPERVLTNKFWKILSSCYTQQYPQPHLTNWTMIASNNASCGLSRICTEYAGGNLMEVVSVSDLIQLLPNYDQAMKPARSVATNSFASEATSARPISVSLRGRAENVANKSHDSSAPIPRQPEESGHATQSGSIPTPKFTYPESTNPISFGYAIMFGNCSSHGCMNKYYSLSSSSFCNRCRWQYCVNHIDRDEHDCNPARRQRIPDGQQHPLGKFPLEPVHTNTNDTPEQATEKPTAMKQQESPLPLIRDVLAVAVRHISAVGRGMLLNVAGGNLGSVNDASRITHVLTCLSEEELKYLPLWAGGFDDGTGGVFGDHIPSANEDSSGLGPGGRRLASRSEGSDYSFVSNAVDSTVNTSTVAHDGYRDSLPRGRVVAMDDVDSSSDGGWSYIQDTIDGGKGKARAFTPEEDSEIASTLGGLENASVIDLGIQSGTDSFDQLDSDMEVKSIGSSDVSSPRTVAGADSHDDQIIDDEDEDEDDFDAEDLDSDDDMNMMFDDELSQGRTAKVASSMAQKPALIPSAQSVPKTILHEAMSMAHISYHYKDDDDDDLMTRL